MARAMKASLNDLGQDAPLAWIERLARGSLGHCASVLTEEDHVAPDEFDQTFAERYSRVAVEENPPFPGVIDVCHYICSIEGKNVIVTLRGRQGTMVLLAAHNMIFLITFSNSIFIWLGESFWEEIGIELAEYGRYEFRVEDYLDRQGFAIKTVDRAKDVPDGYRYAYYLVVCNL